MSCDNCNCEKCTYDRILKQIEKDVQKKIRDVENQVRENS